MFLTKVIGFQMIYSLI